MTIDWGMASRQERIDWIRAQADADLSSGQVAGMAGVTRNVIIGLGNRALPRVTFHGAPAPGGAARIWSPKQKQIKVPKVRAAALKAPLAPARVSDELPPAPFGALGTLDTVGKGECHFPMFSDAMLKATISPSALPYCGHKSDGGEYCEFHHRLMYAPLRPQQNALVNPNGNTRRWNGFGPA